MTEPISVCELDDGSPKYQVPRFQMIAAVSSANTIANPAPPPTCRMSSTGSSEMIPNATVPVETSTPMKFHIPDQTTAIVRLERVRVDDGGNRVGRVVKAVDELEAQRHQQGDAEQDERHHRGRVHVREVGKELGARVADPDGERDSEDRHAELAGPTRQFGVDGGRMRFRLFESCGVCGHRARTIPTRPCRACDCPVTISQRRRLAGAGSEF